MNTSRILYILALLAMAACIVQPVVADLGEFDNGSMAATYYNRGSQAAIAGDLQLANDWFDMALASNLTLVSKADTLLYIYKDKAAVLADLGNYSQAVATADKGLALYKKDPGLWNNKGYALAKMGKYNEAVEAYDEAIKVAAAQNETYIKGYINKGIALNMSGRPFDAITAYKKALESDPGNRDATAGLAEAEKSANLMMAVMAVIVIAAIIVVIWYIKFRKPADSGTKAGKANKKVKKE